MDRLTISIPDGLDEVEKDELGKKLSRIAERETALAKARRMIAEGMAQIDRGESLDGEEVTRELKEKHRRLAAQEGSA